MLRSTEATPVTQATIYHDPKCSKSRATLERLTQRGVDTTVVVGDRAVLRRPPENVDTLL